jgi:hypothetical protein
MCFVNDELVLFLTLFFSSRKVFRVWMMHSSRITGGVIGLTVRLLP